MGIANVIKYEGDNTTFIWKHPLEDFNALSQLIVHESQEAIFFKNGQALDLFGPGRYTLSTQNIPLLGKMLNRVMGDESPFHCEVYFINKTVQMAVRWGTDSRVQYVEPRYGFPLTIGARGDMILRADDSRKLLLKLVGTENYLSQARLVEYFRGILMTTIKSYLAKTIKDNEINIFEIDEKLTVLSVDIHKLLIADFAEYGVVLERFLVTSILKPDGEPQYEKFKELHFRQYADVAEASLNLKVEEIKARTEAQKKIIDSQAEAQKRKQEDYDWKQEQKFKVLQAAAENEGVGSNMSGTMGAGIGISLGGAFGSTIAGIYSGSMSGIMEDSTRHGNESGYLDESSDGIPEMIKLKDEDGNSKKDEPSRSDFETRLDKLEIMRQRGHITDEEYDNIRKQILDEILGHN